MKKRRSPPGPLGDPRAKFARTYPRPSDDVRARQDETVRRLQEAVERKS